MLLRPYAKDIIAEVTFLPPEEGGRKVPPANGYRPTFVYNNQHFISSLWFEGNEIPAFPGPVIVFFEFFRPEHHLGKLIPGKEFELWEGQVVARGRVLEIVNLEKSASRRLEQRTREAK